MQILGADQTEISQNKWTTFGGTSLFPFPLVRTETTDSPFVQNFHFHFAVLLCHYCANCKFFLYTNEITSLKRMEKNPYHLTQTVSGIPNKKFWLHGKCPQYTKYNKLWAISILNRCMTDECYKIKKKKLYTRPTITGAISVPNQAEIEAQQSAGKRPPGAKRRKHTIGVKRGKKTTPRQGQETIGTKHRKKTIQCQV